MTSSKIVALTVENVKRISAVHIEPGEDGCVLIAGQNAAGKSSVLDSICFALGGAGVLQEKPLRDGAKSGSVRLDLGDIVVERKFLESGTSSLKVSTKDGATYSSPQKILDALYCRLSFDPLRFSQMKADEQAKTLIELVGINTTSLDRERAEIYDERTGVNRLVKEAELELAKVPPVEGAEDLPEKRPDVFEITERIQRAVKLELSLKGEREQRESLQRGIEESEKELSDLQKEFESMDAEWASAFGDSEKACFSKAVELKDRHDREIKEMQERHSQERNRLSFQAIEERKRLEKLKEDAVASNAGERAAVESEIAQKRKEISELLNKAQPDCENVAELQEELNRANDLAKRWDAAADRRGREAVLKKRQEESAALTARIDKITEKKREQLAAAKYPIKGLSISESGTVLFDGIPFSQASRAQQIRTSVAMGLAMNPKLKVLLIRDGSLLDDNGLATVKEMANANGAQIWIERVGDKDACAIVIEDGHVRGVEPAAEAEPSEEKPKRTRKTKAREELFS